MSRPAPAPLTPEQLQLAFRHLWRPGWPAVLEDALLDQRIDGLVRGYARSLNRAQATAFARPPRTPAHAAPVPPTPTAPPNLRRTVGPRVRFDARRAAANDRDD